MSLKKALVGVVVVAALGLSGSAWAVGGASGPKVGFPKSGKIGSVVMNPYRIAPLTAVIRCGGHIVTDVSVRIVPKEGGQEIKYTVSDAQVRTHGGIPIFGLYPDYQNTVEVSYTRSGWGKSERVQKEIYKIYAGPVQLDQGGYANVSKLFQTKVTHVDPDFKDRLILINNLSIAPHADSAQVVWNNPMGGALEWNFGSQNAILDTTGEVRWYMNPTAIYDPDNIYRAGIIMGFRQNDDGAISWGYGQRYAKYDLMGREIFNRRLPAGYGDFSHAMDPMPNGNFLLRVGLSDLARPDGKHVRTVRDVIIEVDPSGNVVDEWRLFEILDPYRDNVLKVLDQGAVCLNIDATQAGKTLSAEELIAMDSSDKFGDIAGSGPGRNWLHINSVDYDPTDDSIILSSRHQSALIKIGRDKEVKWILSSPEGWKPAFAKKLLTPVDAQGKKIACEGSKCEGDFDWSWTSHTGWRIDSKSEKGVVYLSVFDNGDARGMEQPALPSMKYSRAVVYKIDEGKMTAEQVWEYGKERGNAWFSPVTSLTEYQPDKDSVFIYSATAGARVNLRTGGFESAPNPYITEVKWSDKSTAIEMRLINTQGYQAMPIDIQKAFNAR